VPCSSWWPLQDLFADPWSLPLFNLCTIFILILLTIFCKRLPSPLPFPVELPVVQWGPPFLIRNELQMNHTEAQISGE
jgi:MFS superfamily sulfate permease-like transporter